MPTVTLAKFSAVFVWLIHNCPDWLLRLTSPRLNGVVIFRKVSLNGLLPSSAVPFINLVQTLKAQIKSILKNPQLLDDAPHRIIYSELLSPAIKGGPMPTATQLQNEAQVLFAAGSHTVGTTLMVGTYNLLRSPEAKKRLEDEVRAAWPVLDQPPSYEDLEKLPFLASRFIFVRRAVGA